ncbi:MAG: sigma-70 family RNA polymerase sigma factor, partial [Dehalococcoidia bacterium]
MAQEASVASVALLVGRAVRREVVAFEQLYSLFIDRIYRYFLYRVGDGHRAEDLTSAVFLKAWHSIDRYQERGVPFGAWLYRIAHNVAVDHFRSQQAEIPLEDQALYLPSGDHVEDGLEKRFTQQQIRRALGGLKKDQRQVILLHF